VNVERKSDDPMSAPGCPACGQFMSSCTDCDRRFCRRCEPAHAHLADLQSDLRGTQEMNVVPDGVSAGAARRVPLWRRWLRSLTGG
jgi:hypothetical protein